MSVIALRIIFASVYSLVGLVPLTVIPFYFSPWWTLSWMYFAIVLAWIVAGVAFDPYSFFFDAAPFPLLSSRLGRLIQQWRLLVLALLLLLPFIAYDARFWNFFPWWGPWYELARYWVPREAIVAGLFAIVIPIVWASLTFGRRLTLLLGFLFVSHMMLLLAYAVIYPSPDYLQDGYTQDYFVSQLRFKIIAGVILFVALQYWARKRARHDTEQAGRTEPRDNVPVSNSASPARGR